MLKNLTEFLKGVMFQSKYCSTPPVWCRIDPGLGAAATRVPASSREDSLLQDILKFHRPGSLDYRARHGLPSGVFLGCKKGGADFCSMQKFYLKLQKYFETDQNYPIPIQVKLPVE